MAHNITTAEVEKISNLARLALQPEEAEQASAYLADVIGYVKSLATLATKNTPPWVIAEQDSRTMRRDESKPCAARDELLSGARVNERGFVEAPAVFLEKE